MPAAFRARNARSPNAGGACTTGSSAPSHAGDRQQARTFVSPAGRAATVPDAELRSPAHTVSDRAVARGARDEAFARRLRRTGGAVMAFGLAAPLWLCVARAWFDLPIGIGMSMDSLLVQTQIRGVPLLIVSLF